MNLKTLFLLLFLFTFSNTAIGENKSPWVDLTNTRSKTSIPPSALMPDHYRLLQLDEVEMQHQLNSIVGGNAPNQSITQDLINIPYPDGTSSSLILTKNSVMDPELAAKYPGIKTYQVESRFNKGIYGGIEMTEKGFHAMLFMQDGKRLFIDPREIANEKYYISYYDKDYHPENKKAWTCDVEGHQHTAVTTKPTINNSPFVKRSGATLRTYRLAMAATGEYTAFHGGTDEALAAIVTTINRVNTIYERDLATRVVLIDNTDQLIMTDTTTYSNNSGLSMLTENQSRVDQVIGTNNYDIGHVFSTGGGGIAALGSVCNTNSKAQGVTGSGQPVNDPFDIDYVAHEIGHQFGGPHTFNSTTGSCGGGNRSAATAYEPGSGTTIMAYAGICGSDNVQNNSDAMFHLKSIEQMSNFINNASSGGSCGVSSSLNNQQPGVNAGADYHTPANTPFELSGSGSDADGDNLTYSWEQVDAGQASTVSQDQGNNAIFRAFLPTATPVRTFPSLNNILQNTTSTGELVPANPRTLKFALAVRDNKGGVTIDDMQVDIVASSGFKITSHNTTETIEKNSLVSLTWDVAGTTVSPVNCSNVDISLTTDGGNTFTQLMAGITIENDGAEDVLIPSTINNSTTARFKVKCSDNIFFDISDADLTVEDGDGGDNGIDRLYSLTPILNDLGDNALADPGETIRITVPLKNLASTTATQVSGTLSSTIANVLVPNSNYPDIATSGQANNGTDFRLTIPTTHTCGVDVPYALKANYILGTASETDFSFTIPTGDSSTKTYNNTTAVNISDGSSAGNESSLTVTGAGVVNNANVNIDINITHTWRGDLSIQLTSPAGTTVQLKNENFNDSESNVTGNFPGSLTPVGDLAAFSGENFDGDWVLKVVDHFGGDTGTLNSWSLSHNSLSCEVPSDGDTDGINDLADNCPSVSNANQINTDGDALGNDCDDDDDNDGMPDTWEETHGLNPLDPSDASQDADDDDKSNLEEYQQGSDPNTPEDEPDSDDNAKKAIPILLELLLNDQK